MATAMAMSHLESTICVHCSQSLGAHQSVGTSALPPQPLGPSCKHVQQNNFGFNSYQRPLFCLTCGKSGHSESRCWVRFGHLHVAVDPSTIIPPQSYSPVLQDAFHYNLGPSFSFQGPDTATHPSRNIAFPSLHETLGNRQLFSNEYCFTLKNDPLLLSLRTPDGDVYPGDTPGRWLVDSGASCHYSPIKQLFLNLQPINPPVRILTGNRYIEVKFRGPIPSLFELTMKYTICICRMFYLCLIYNLGSTYSVWSCLRIKASNRLSALIMSRSLVLMELLWQLELASGTPGSLMPMSAHISYVSVCR